MIVIGELVMVFDDIKELVKKGESETLEFKETTGSKREVAKTVCAMLNNRGGIIVIGVRSDGVISGQKMGKGTIEKVVGELRRIDPPFFPRIDRVNIGGELEVLVIEVFSGDTVPYRYGDCAYRRYGNTTCSMSRDEEYQMYVGCVHSEQRWENQFAEGWGVDDLDLDELQRTVDKIIDKGRFSSFSSLISREPVELLCRLGLCRDNELLRAAVVLFGKSKRIEVEMLQCVLKVARFRGVDRTEFLDNRQFRGNAFSLFSYAERFLSENLPIAGRIDQGSFVRIDEPLYPLKALREALANALCHRDYASGGGSVSVGIYDDRLEITSTGPLHFGLTSEKLFEVHESLLWNPLIAEVFFNCGVIEKWGRGTTEMAKLVEDAGLPKLEIEEVSGCVTVRFRQNIPVSPQRVIQDRSVVQCEIPFFSQTPHRVGRNLSERQRVILKFFNSVDEWVAVREVWDHLGRECNRRQVRYALSVLRELGLVTCEGKGSGARWRRSGGI